MFSCAQGHRERVVAEFEPILLRYDGLDTDSGLIDLTQIGLSLQGASKILGSAGSLVVTGQYARRAPALSVKVFGGVAHKGSWEIPAVLVTLAPVVTPLLPHIQDFTKKAATKAVTGIFNFAVARLSGRKRESEMAFGIAETALREMGHTSRAAIEAVERIALNQRPAVRLFVSPIGESCGSARVGDQSNGAIEIDKTTRDAIDAAEPFEIGQFSQFDILISELDLVNRSCKFAVRDSDDPDHRLTGIIVDPVLEKPENPYSKSMSLQRWLQVIAKPELRDGEVERLYISETIPRLQLTSG
jgi:hypothetical protein